MNKSISRRKFLKYLAGSAATAAPTTSLLLSSCKGNPVLSGSSADNAMTTRVNPNSGDIVGLLGYGMMRLPELP